MLKLNQDKDQNDIYLSSVFTHPAQSNGSNVAYTITHNLGKRPDWVGVYEVGTHRPFIPTRDYWQNNFPSFTLYSRGYLWQSDNANQITLYIYNLDGARDIYVKVFLLGDPVQAL